MDSVGYRSFLVRAWGRGRETGRVLVEEVQSGRRAELHAGDAVCLLAEIERALATEPTRRVVEARPAGRVGEEEADDD